MPKTNALALLALLLLAASFQCSTAAEEEKKTDGGADGAGDVLDLSGEGMTVKQPDFNEPLADGWSPVKTIGADLACSACEIIVDRLQSQMRTAEHVAKEQAKKDKKEEGTEDKKADDEAADKKDDSKDKKDDKKSESKGNKKDKEKDKKDKEKDKKGEKVKINKAEVAGVVVEGVCNHTNFIGMSKIGSYPGRKYTWANYESSAATFQIQKDVTNICRSIFSNDDAKAYVVKALSSGGKSKVKRMKRNLCERRAKVCKSAALGYEAESACVMKSMRAFDKGDYEKAKQYAADCGAQTV